MAAPAATPTPTPTPTPTLAASLASVAAALRARAPLVHCIANFVSMDLMANVLLAAGASPAMIHAPEEAAAFTPLAGALSVNIGTLDAQWATAMAACTAAARAKGVPWVLDPVGVGATPWRTGIAAELARGAPAAIRANASEVLALAAALGCEPGAPAAGGKGVDSAHGSGEAVAAARALARATGAVVVVTGAIDFVVAPDGARMLAVTSGTPLLTRITATGCSLSSLVAACIAAGRGAGVGDVEAAAAACAVFGAAADAAAVGAAGPGSLRVGLLDALHRGGGLEGVRVEEVA